MLDDMRPSEATVPKPDGLTPHQRAEAWRRRVKTDADRALEAVTLSVAALPDSLELRECLRWLGAARRALTNIP